MPKPVTVRACRRPGGAASCGMCTDSPASYLVQGSAGCSVTAWRWSSHSLGAKTNGMRRLWPPASELLRQTCSTRPRFVVRRQAGVLGGGASACRVPELRQGEAGEAGLARGQSILHQALRLLRRATMPSFDDQGRGQGASSRLADGQGGCTDRLDPLRAAPVHVLDRFWSAWFPASSMEPS